MTAKVILNPYAGRWSAIKRRPEAEAALHAAGIEFNLEITDRPGHATEIAMRAVQSGFDPIIAAGGDGTISEVVNGIAQAGNALENPKLLATLGVLPLGSADDLVHNLKLPLDLIQAARIIHTGNTRAMDLGSVDSKGKQRFFDNNSGVGLEPSITLIQQRMKRLRGVLRYLVATLIGIAHNPQWTMQLEWEGGSYRGPVTLATVGNNPLTGGLFYLTPHATPFDGLLTFVHGALLHRMQILRILPRAMKPGAGSYVEHPDVYELHTTWLKIISDQSTPLHADGEIMHEATREINYRVLPGRLPILMP